MSIKSQKSLAEECSEIWEKSYSVRSASYESLSCNDQYSALSLELLSAMTPAVLSQLRRKYVKGVKSHIHSITNKVEAVMRSAAAEEGIEFAPRLPAPHPLTLDQETFVNTIDEIFGNHKYSIHAKTLYQELDPFSTGRSTWGALLDKLVEVGARKTRSKADLWNRITEDKGDLKRLGHCKRETIVRLVPIEAVDSFCYAAVSRGGRVGLYSGGMTLLHHYEVWSHRYGTSKRVKNTWITDAVYMSDVQSLLISASDRSLTIYDASILSHTPVYCITGLPNIPTCVAYRISSRAHPESELVIGDERGNLTRLQFLNISVSLLHKEYSDKTNACYWPELQSPPHNAYCTITVWSKVHNRSVKRVQCISRQDTIVSCSHDGQNSVVLKSRAGQIRDYVFKVTRGVTCFHAVPSLHLLATGSPDGLVRLWETTQSTPFATLQATSRSAVLDVAVVPDKEVVVATCKNCTVDIWDLYEECLLQNIKIKYPFLGVLGKKVEFGSYCLHPGPPLMTRSGSVSPLEPSSRRSSVCRGETGGLIIRPVEEVDDQTDTSELQFSSPQLYSSCCDHVYRIRLSAERCLPPPPPRDARPPRRPSAWDLTTGGTLLGLTPDPPKTTLSSAEPTPRAEPAYLTPAAARIVRHESPVDLDELLERADLKGVLEKDFVLMMGLKHDLNKKLAALGDNMKEMSLPVSQGAPYLALSLHAPEPLAPAHLMVDRYQAVMSLFPAPSTAASPRSIKSDSSRSKKTRTNRS